MGVINDFLNKVNNLTRGVNNITRTVNNVNSSIRGLKIARDSLLGGNRQRSTPSRKPLGLTPVSKSTSGRNSNIRPVRPTPIAKKRTSEKGS